MITVKDYFGENLVGFSMQDQIDEKGIEQLLKVMHEKAEKFGKIRLYGEYHGFKGWETVKALLTTMKVKFQAWKSIEKYAIVSQKEWIRNTSKIADVFTPHYEVKAFEELDEALAWLNKPADVQIKHGVARLKLSDEQIVGFAVVGKLSSADYALMNEAFEKHLQKFPHLRLYFEIIQCEGIELPALWDDFKTGIKYYKDIKKAAVVGPKGWMEKLTEVSNLLTPGLDMKYFELEKREVALEWLK